MSEKKVSVRLVAENGRQVRAELEGIGDAGTRAFSRIDARARAVGRAVAVAVAAMAAAAITGFGALARSSMNAIDQQAKLAQSLGTTVESVQILGRAADMAGVSMGEAEAGVTRLSRRLSVFAQSGGGPAADAIRRLNLNATTLMNMPLDQRLAAINAAMDNYATQSERGALLSQLFGDRAFAAFSRLDTQTLAQATKDMRDFGVVVSEQDADQIERANDALSRMGLIWRGLGNQLAVAAAPGLEAAADAFAALARTTGPLGQAIGLVIGNLDRLATYAAGFAAFMAGRWVAAFVAARVATFSLAAALTVLRTAIIRTGIGALIVGAGELIHQFGRLVQRVGGLGTAFRLMGGVALEVGQRIGDAFGALFHLLGAGWEGYRAAVFTVLDGIVTGMVKTVDRTIAIWKGGFDALAAIWGHLPDVIGDFAFRAANGLIAGVEAMLNGVVSRINQFIAGINWALSALPDWAVGEGGVELKTLDPLDLGRIDNPFAGAAGEAGRAAAEAFSAAWGETWLEAPSIFGDLADEAASAAGAHLEAAGQLAEAVTRPLESWQALKDAMAGTGEDGSDALDDAAGAAGRVADALDRAGGAAGRAGSAAHQAGKDGKDGADEAATGWAAVSETLADYAGKAREIGSDIGTALVGAFRSAENAVGEFVKTGKLNFRDLVTSLLADLAKLGARKFLLGPLAGALGNALGGMGGSIFANVLHAGGMVGAAGPGRMVPAAAFAAAPRMHSGGWAGLRPDEVPAILQKGERVLSRREAASFGGNVTVNIQARDAESFRQSRTQIAADIARAVAAGRRGM